MDEVFINQEADPYVLEADGTLDLAALQLQPSSIVINRSVTTCTPSCRQNVVLTYTMVINAARRAWLMCKPAKLRGGLQIFSRKFCMILQLVARQTHCTFLAHQLQVMLLCSYLRGCQHMTKLKASSAWPGHVLSDLAC